jgi:hypothetical protein
VNTALFTDPEAAKRRRHAALADAIDMCRRTAAAVAAANAGEDREMRHDLLAGIHTRLLSMCEQLKALA